MLWRAFAETSQFVAPGILPKECELLKLRKLVTNMSIPPNFTEEDHQRFMAQGYLRLGRLLDDDALRALQQRIDAIMLGEIPYPTMSFQLDGTTGEYRNLPPDTPGHKGATLAYRRITGLEQDPLFRAYIQHPLIRAITQRYIGDEVSIFAPCL